MPGTAPFSLSHHGSSLSQVDFAKPLADGFAGAVNTETRFLMTRLISLLPGHTKNDNKLLSVYTNFASNALGHPFPLSPVPYCRWVVVTKYGYLSPTSTMHRALTIPVLLFSCILGTLADLVQGTEANPSQAPIVLGKHPGDNTQVIENVPLITVADLLADPDRYHERIITVRGIVTQLELHVDTSTLFIDFVFWLKEGDHRVLVFGQHDRTLGDIQMVTGRVVEVRGLFWKERTVGEYHFNNNLEAQQVRFYPPVNPDRT